MKKDTKPKEKLQEDDKKEEVKEEKQHIKKDANFLLFKCDKQDCYK